MTTIYVLCCEFRLFRLTLWSILAVILTLCHLNKFFDEWMNEYYKLQSILINIWKTIMTERNWHHLPCVRCCEPSDGRNVVWCRTLCLAQTRLPPHHPSTADLSLKSHSHNYRSIYTMQKEITESFARLTNHHHCRQRISSRRKS